MPLEERALTSNIEHRTLNVEKGKNHLFFSLGGIKISMKLNNPTLRIITVLVCGVLWLGTAGTALAQDDEALAKQLRAEGAQALREGRQEEALAIYKRSLELDHDPNIEKFVKKLEGVVQKQRLPSKPAKPYIPPVEPPTPAVKPSLPIVESNIPPEESYMDVAGAYDTELGGSSVDLVLEQEGNRVTGTYNKGASRLEGTMMDRSLKGKFYYNQATSPTGIFEFIFSEDGTRFFGSWKNGLTGEPNNQWDGKRAAKRKASPVASGNLTLEKTVFGPSEKIKVYFQASSAFAENAWVGIIPSNVSHGSERENDKHDLSYQHLNKRTTGHLIFNAPAKPGSYDFRMHDTDNNGHEVASVSWVVESAATGEVKITSAFRGNSQWDSNFNKLHLTQNGNSFSGTYEYSGGKVIGILEGRRLKGWWLETDDTQDCGPDKRWSGPYLLDFSGDGKSFTGTYGKCSAGVQTFESLVMDNSWHGTYLSGQIDFGSQ